MNTNITNPLLKGDDFLTEIIFSIRTFVKDSLLVTKY